MIQNRKKYVFNLYTLNNEGDIYVKRASYYNTLYIYVYERSLFKVRLLLSLKVVVNE
jgi:hypothetical protein